MPTDRYTKAMLTIIAFSLLWLVVDSIVSPVRAQTARVERIVIAGIDIPTGAGGYDHLSSLPVNLSNVARTSDGALAVNLKYVYASPLPVAVQNWPKPPKPPAPPELKP